MITRILLGCCLLLAPLSRAGEWMKFPPFDRTVLPNGATLLLLEKHDAPLITLLLSLRSGSIQDPPGQEGLAEITNELLRKGAGSRTAAQIAEELDYIGARLETDATLEMTSVQLDFMAKDLAKGMEIFADLVLAPKFPAPEVSKLIQQQIDEIRAAKDQPLQVLPEYYRRFLFESHPYGRPPGGTEQSLAALKRTNVVEFHKKTYTASNMVFAVAGDFATSAMKELLRERFGKLPPEAPALQKIAPPEKAAASRLLLVDKPDSTQSFFALGNVGLAIDDPDRLAANLVNTLFGGRFTSRLNTALRIDSGLSYGASSRFTPNRCPGQFTILSFTKNESTGEALDAALKVLNELHQSGLTTAELDSGKAYMKGQFGPTLETSAQLAARLALFEIYGLDPKEEVDHYAARLDAITLAGSRRVIERLFPSTNLVFTVIGKAETIAPVVKKYAPGMRTISISEPGFGGQKD